MQNMSSWLLGLHACLVKASWTAPGCISIRRLRFAFRSGYEDRASVENAQRTLACCQGCSAEHMHEVNILMVWSRDSLTLIQGRQ